MRLVVAFIFTLTLICIVGVAFYCFLVPALLSRETPICDLVAQIIVGAYPLISAGIGMLAGWQLRKEGKL